VALLTGGFDKSYAWGLSSALSAEQIDVDFVGSDDLDCAEILAVPRLRFLNLRGDQRENVPQLDKVRRVLLFYARLFAYVVSSKTPILHILWNNRFEWFDRTLLMVFYRAAGKKVAMTVHNVNEAKRDGYDNWFNRFCLRTQYRLSHHLFVHTPRMRDELAADFGVDVNRITVIPFGINDSTPQTALTRHQAKQMLGLGADERTLLLFGQMAPYKGITYLVEALAILAQSGQRIRLLVAGKIKRGSEDYWAEVERLIGERQIDDLVVRRIGHVPDAEVEKYFKAADAVVIPYVHIFQSGVPFLAFSFGAPVIATDVGSLRDDVTGDMGVICRPRDAADLARAITEFFSGPLYAEREQRRAQIRQVALDRYSWTTVGTRTRAVYEAVASGR
jgi:D-inositol-3-phosphate glycosyltransferase